MNKNEKEYVSSRIREIINKKMIRCSCSEPDLTEHLKKAAVDGELKLKPSALIKESAKLRVVNSGSNYSMNLDFSQLFAEPKSYIAAKTAHLIEVEQIKESNDSRKEFAERLIDRVHLNEFEDGNKAISEAISAFVK